MFMIIVIQLQELIHVQLILQHNQDIQLFYIIQLIIQQLVVFNLYNLLLIKKLNIQIFYHNMDSYGNFLKIHLDSMHLMEQKNLMILDYKYFHLQNNKIMLKILQIKMIWMVIFSKMVKLALIIKLMVLLMLIQLIIVSLQFQVNYIYVMVLLVKYLINEY